ncbi:STN domain-containing protein, partial [Bacteroides finegoldii]
MRISLTLLFLVVLQLSAENSYAQRMRIAISMSNVSVEQVLNKIEETSDYVFLYNDETIQKSRIVSVRSKSGKITDILDDIFKGTDISYTVIDKQIILSKSNKVNQTAKAIQIKG